MDDLVKPKTNKSDPLNVNGRLYHAVSDLLDALNDDASITTRERIAAIVAIARIQVVFMNLRKENKDDPAAGSAVRKYASAFSQNASGKRKKRAGSATTVPESDPFESDGFDDDGGDAA